jgi:hypothetical protein
MFEPKHIMKETDLWHAKPFNWRVNSMVISLAISAELETGLWGINIIAISNVFHALLLTRPDKKDGVDLFLQSVDIKPKQTRTRAQHQDFNALCFDYRTVKINPNTLYWRAGKCVEAHVHSLSSVSLLSLTFAYAMQPRTSTYKEKQMQLRAWIQI